MKRVFIFIAVFFTSGVSYAEDCSEASKLLNDSNKLLLGSVDSESKLREAIELCPEMSEAHYNLGVHLLSQKRYSDSLQYLNKALSLRKDKNYYLALANANVYLRDFSSAEENYQKVLEIDSNHLGAYQGLSAIYNQQAKNVEAERILREAINSHPGDAVLYYNLGVVLENSLKLEQAVVSYQTATEKKTNYAEAYRNLGRVYLRKGDHKNARKALNTASYLLKNDLEVYMLLSHLYDLKEDFETGLEFIEKALQLDEKNKTAKLNHAILLAKLDQVDKAEEILANLNQGQLAKYYSVKGWVFLKSQKIKEAEGVLVKAVELDPRSKESLYNLAVVYKEQGKKELAKKYFEEAEKYELER